MRLSVLEDSPFYGGRLCMFAQVTLNGEPVRMCQEFDDEAGWVLVLDSGPNGGTVVEFETVDGRWISEHEEDSTFRVLTLADKTRLTGVTRMRASVLHGQVEVAFPDLAPGALEGMMAQIGDGARAEDAARRAERDERWLAGLGPEEQKLTIRMAGETEQWRAERNARVEAAARAGHVLGDDAP